jgi:hypothetical protein
MTKIDPRMMIISSLNPAKASSGLRMPETTRTMRRRNVTMSTDSFSVAKMITAVTSNPRTSAISQVIFERRLSVRNA